MEIKSKETTTTWKETIRMKMFIMVLAIAANPNPKEILQQNQNKKGLSQ